MGSKHTTGRSSSSHSLPGEPAVDLNQLLMPQAPLQQFECRKDGVSQESGWGASGACESFIDSLITALSEGVGSFTAPSATAAARTDCSHSQHPAQKTSSLVS